MCSKAFTRKTFTWLRQINHDKGVLAIDVRLAVELTDYFREKDQGGRAYPAAKTLGKAVGVSEQTALRSVDRMVKRGHLYVIPGKPGRGHPNQYWMIVKPVEKTSIAVEVFQGQKTSTRGRPKTSIRDEKTSIAVRENHLRTTKSPSGESYALPQKAGERESALRANQFPRSGRAP
jgi:hypothetical protein